MTSPFIKLCLAQWIRDFAKALIPSNPMYIAKNAASAGFRRFTRQVSFLMRLFLEQSPTEIYASAGGRAVVGPIINRHIGQDTLIGPDAPICKADHRRRPRTVLQEMIYEAARLVRHGRRYVLGSSRGDPGYTASALCYTQLVGA